MDEAMKGGRKDVRVAMARAHSRLDDSEQNGIRRIIMMRSNNLSPSTEIAIEKLRSPAAG